MMKRILYLGLAVTLLTLGTSCFSPVSAKEKTVISTDVGFDLVTLAVENTDVFISVSRETGFNGIRKIKFDPLRPGGLFLPEMRYINDPYLYRSDKWIRDRNLYLKGLKTNFEDSQTSFVTFRL